jgi:hypothetical protein
MSIQFWFFFMTEIIFPQQTKIFLSPFFFSILRDCHGHDLMVVGLTTTVKVLFFVGINFRGLVKNYKFVDS